MTTAIKLKLRNYAELRRALKQQREALDRYMGQESRLEWRAAFSKDVEEARAEGVSHALGGMRGKRRHEIEFDRQEQSKIEAFQTRIATLEWVIGLKEEL